MVSVPSFLLRRLYVKESLTNTTEGFEFQLRNQLGSGYAHKLLPLTVDGAQISPESTYFNLDGKETAFADVSREVPFTLALNKSILVKVKGTTLSAGSHKIGVAFEIPGLGVLSFDFTDVARNG